MNIAFGKNIIYFYISIIVFSLNNEFIDSKNLPLNPDNSLELPIKIHVKRELSNYNNEKNNYFIYFNLQSNKNLENQTKYLTQDNINSIPSSNEFIQQILKLLFVNTDNLSTSTAQPLINLIDENKQNFNQNLKLFYDTNIITSHFNTLFRILSFIAFVLVLFSLISLVGLILFMIGHKFEFRANKSKNCETISDNESNSKGDSSNEDSICMSNLNSLSVHTGIKDKKGCNSNNNSKNKLLSHCKLFKGDLNDQSGDTLNSDSSDINDDNEHCKNQRKFTVYHKMNKK